MKPLIRMKLCKMCIRASSEGARPVATKNSIPLACASLIAEIFSDEICICLFNSVPSISLAISLIILSPPIFYLYDIMNLDFLEIQEDRINMKKLIGNDWDEILAPAFDSEQYQKLHDFLKSEYQTKQIFPDMYHLSLIHI